MAEKGRDEVIAGIRSCLVSVKGKCNLRQIGDDFHMLMGYKIPYAQLGYKTLEQFILSIPSLSTSRPNGQLLVDAKPTEKSSHIASLVDKQRDVKKKPRPPPRYMERANYNHTPIVSRWRPKTVNGNWRKSYQSSPRPAAVSHNQFVNVPFRSKPQNAAKFSNVPQIEASDQTAERRDKYDTNSLSVQAKKRIYKRMADLSLSSSPDTNGTAGDWNHHTSSSSASPIISPSDVLNLRRESFENPGWNWPSNENADKSRGKLGLHSNKKQEKKLELTGDHLADLHAFTALHNIDELNITIKQRIPKMGKLKTTIYMCHIKVGSDSFSSYPREFYDEEAAKQYAAKLALDELLQKYSRQEPLLVSDDKDVLERIPPLVQSHYSGVWNTELETTYMEKYNEQLPVNWLEVVDTLPCITVLPLLDKRFVLRFCKPGEKGTSHAPPSKSNVSVPPNTVKFDDKGILVAMITCVASAGEIWCQQVNTPEEDAFTQMSTKLGEYYTSKGKSEKAETVELGGYYVAFYENAWSRVRAFEISGNDISCFCIDFGDEWILQKDSLFRLHQDFALLPAQAFVCRLAGVEELYEASKTSEYLHNLINKYVQVQLDTSNEDHAKNSPNDPALSVILYDAETDTIINQQLISIVNIESASPVLNLKSPTQVYVTQALNDGRVYVRVHSVGFEQLEGMLKELEKNLLDHKIEPGKQHITPKNSENKLYLAKSSDGRWYRSRIIDWSPHSSHVQVLLVDWGRTIIVDLKEEVMYPLDEWSDVLNQYPEQAIKVRMFLNKIHKDFVPKVMSLMPSDHLVLVKVLKEDPTNGHLVEFFKRSETDSVLFSVNTALAAELEFKNASSDGNNNTNKSQSTKLQRLISLKQFDRNVPSSGFLSCPTLPNVGSYLDVKIPCAVNPYNFFVQPYASHEKLQELMKNLQARYGSGQHSPLSIEDVQPGKIYASMHEDGIWYRTCVMKVIHQGSISVFYCDFGYYANLTLKQLVTLDSEFTVLPYQAIKAKLAGIEPKNSKWSMDDCRFFEHLVCKKSFVSVLVAKETDDLYKYDTLLSLKLIDTSTSVDIYIDKVLVTEGIAKYTEH